MSVVARGLALGRVPGAVVAFGLTITATWWIEPNWIMPTMPFGAQTTTVVAGSLAGLMAFGWVPLAVARGDLLSACAGGVVAVLVADGRVIVTTAEE